jgi:hypothetical protein
MSSSIACQVISLGKLLRLGDTFVVPPYQRNYAWEEEQYAQFWSDISKTIFNSDHEYFLGSIVFDNSAAPDLRVIDGQQRLITTSVLISALRGRLDAAGNHKLAEIIEKNFLARSDYRHHALTPCVILNSNDKAFYDAHIFEKCPYEALNSMAHDETLAVSNRLLAECYCHMYRKIDELHEAGRKLEDIAGAIMSALNHRVFLIRIDVKDDYNAFLVFETLNDRGVELSEADLLKNHLFAVSNDLLADAQANWESMEQNLGNAPPLKFIRHHWMATHGVISERGLYSDLKNSIATPEAALEYSQSLCDAAELYAALGGAEHHLWNSFSGADYDSVHAGLKSVEVMRSEQLYIVLLAALSVDSAGFPDILRMLVNFSFRYSTICNFSASNLSAPFIAAARHIRQNGKAQAPDIFNRFLARLYPDDAQFHSAFSRKTSRNNALARHILAAINGHLSPPPVNEVEGGEETRLDHVLRLEHILPKRYQNSWQAPRKEFPGGPEKYIYRLGNMTLIPEELNHELGNAPFDVKREEFAKQNLDITRRIAEANKWTAEEINRRQNWMAGLAVKIWRAP